MTEIRFGTDGWRGRMADDYTFANVRRCAQGFANWLLDGAMTPKQSSSVTINAFRASFSPPRWQRCWLATASRSC